MRLASPSLATTPHAPSWCEVQSRSSSGTTNQPTEIRCSTAPKQSTTSSNVRSIGCCRFSLSCQRPYVVRPFCPPAEPLRCLESRVASSATCFVASDASRRRTCKAWARYAPKTTVQKTHGSAGKFRSFWQHRTKRPSHEGRKAFHSTTFSNFVVAWIATRIRRLPSRPAEFRTESLAFLGLDRDWDRIQSVKRC